MTNRTDYEAWENNPSYSDCHAMIIDRGDLAAAKRLTLMDKKFVDIGYAATYPAPCVCILSDISSFERRGAGTQIGEIILANGNGQFDTLLSSHNILKQRFTILRGSTAWSLSTTIYPNIFLPIILGEIAEVRFGAGIVTLIVRARTYKLQQTVGGFDASISTDAIEPPFAIGKCFNVKGVLVNSGTNQYRFNSVETDKNISDPTLDRLVVRDQGVVLDDPGEAGPDYSLNDDTGPLYKGMATLTGGSPTGQLTSDLNFGNSSIEAELVDTISDFIYRTFGSMVLEDEYFPTTASTSREFVSLGKAGKRIYYQSNATVLTQLDMSVAVDVSSITDPAKTVTLHTSTVYTDIHWKADGTVFWAIRANYIETYELSTAWELDSATYNASKSIFLGTTWFLLWTTDRLRGLFVHEEKSFLLSRDGIIWQGGDMSNDSAVGINTSMTIVDRMEIRPSWIQQTFRWTFNDERTILYLLDRNAHLVVQYDLLEVGNPGELRYAHRLNFFPESEILRGLGHLNSIAVYGDKMLVLRPVFQDRISDGSQVAGDDSFLEFSGLEDGNLPRELFRNNVKDTRQLFAGGVAYPGATQAGKVIKDLLSCWDAEYSVSRLGAMVAVQLKEPEYTLQPYEENHLIYLGDFIGNRGEHIVHKRNHRANYKFTMRHSKNFTVQSADSLAGLVSDENKDLYSAPYQVTEDEVVLADYVDPEEMLIDTFLSNSSEASSLLGDIRNVFKVERNEYELQTNLRWTSLLSQFGLGSIIEIGDDIDHPDFSPGDQCIVIERRVNWSKNTQRIRVFK